MNKTILIIGAGFGQEPAILKAKEMDVAVVVIDRNPDAVGMKHADFAYPTDVIDFDGALAIAKKHQIDGVMTMQTDLPVPTVGYVIDKLNLKGSGYEVAERCSNKISTRKAFKIRNVPQPEFEIIKNVDEAILAAKKIGFPCIIKSPDSSGSRGVTKVKSIDDIQNAVEEAFRYTKKQTVLVEEFIAGLEVGAQAFSVNGECVKVLVHNDTVADPPYMVPIGHSFPIDLSKKEEQVVIRAVKNAVEALGIADGSSNIDLILDKNRNPKIIEIGARIGATCLPELVEYHTGIDWVKQTINAALGLKVNLNEKNLTPVVAYIIQSPKDGILKKFQIPSVVINHPNVKEVEITAKIGEEVNILRKGTDRIGKIVVVGDSEKEANELAQQLLKRIVIEVA